MRSAFTLAVASFLLAGCGSHDSVTAPRLPHDSPVSEKIDRAFWVDAALFCRPFLRYESRHPSVGPPGMNPERPTRAQLGQLVAEERRTHDPFLQPRAWTLMVERVGVPRTGAGLWRPIAHDLRRYDAAHGALVRASRARDVTAWRRGYHRTNAALTQLGVDFSAASAPSANACTQLFG